MPILFYIGALIMSVSFFILLIAFLSPDWTIFIAIIKVGFYALLFGLGIMLLGFLYICLN